MMAGEALVPVSCSSSLPATPLRDIQLLLQLWYLQGQIPGPSLPLACQSLTAPPALLAADETYLPEVALPSACKHIRTKGCPVIFSPDGCYASEGGCDRGNKLLVSSVFCKAGDHLSAVPELHLCWA